MEPQTTSTVSNLDPQAVNLAKAIRQTESGGNFQAKGKSGEYGAYQFTEPTWNTYAKKHGVNVALNQATPEQQNEVAYKQIKEWKDSGYDVGQIASLWNSGKPDAYKDTSYKGINKMGVSYDVPAYAKSVATAYQKLKSGGQVSADPNNPSSTANPNIVQPIQNSADQKSAEEYGALIPAKTGEGPVAAGLKSIANVPSSFYTLGKGLVNAVAHPIKTVEGVGNAAVGAVETGFNKLAGKPVPENNQTKTFGALANAMKERYGSLENAQRTATNDPAGFGADVLSILEGGATLVDKALGTTGIDIAKNAAREGTENFVQGKSNINVMPQVGKGKVSGLLDSVIGKTSQIATAPVKAVANTGYKLGTGLLGKALGVEGETVRQGVSSAVKGGDTYKSFVEGLKGNSSPEELVNQARSALNDVVSNRSNEYKKMLSGLGEDKTTYDISPIYNEVDKQLSKFGIEKGKEGLDFSRSKFALDTTAQKDIENLYNYTKSYGTKAGDRTALGIDNLKQVLGGYYSPNSDYRSFTEGIRKSARSVLDNAPGYSDAMKRYAEMTDNIKDIQKGLSLGDNVMVETSFKKLTGAFKENNEFRAQLIKELDQVSGGGLLPKIAGQQMSSWTSRGLIGSLERAGGIGSVFSTGGATFLPVLGTLMATSPRVVGTFIRTLHLPSESVRRIMSVLNKIAVPGVLAANAKNRITP